MTRHEDINCKVRELAAAVDGQVFRGECARHSGLTETPENGQPGKPDLPVCIDSRQVEPGDLFWALRGPKHDGNEFVEDAIQAGAAAVLTDLPAERVEAIVKRNPGACAVRVIETDRALTDYALCRRKKFAGQVIGVTGSVGKTTTRQMIHTVLSSRYSGSASPKNFNNRIGVRVAMTQMEPSHDYAVLELGASQPGDIMGLASWVRPDMGVITRVGDAHLGGFGARPRVLEAKTELLAALPPEGIAVVDGDPWLLRHARSHGRALVSVGEDAHCSVKADDVELRGGHLFFSVSGFRFRVPVWGRHHVTAALSAIAVGRMFGIPDLEISDALSSFQAVPMRCEVVEIRGATIINDCYNASPQSVDAALELLGQFDSSSRRIVVLGDMLGLGDEATRLHRRAGQHAAQCGRADLLFAIGRHAQDVIAGAYSVGMDQSHGFNYPTLEDAIPQLGREVQPGDAVLVKGSRGMSMERVVEALSRFPSRPAA